jgi:hypothetical protein
LKDDLYFWFRKLFQFPDPPGKAEAQGGRGGKFEVPQAQEFIGGHTQGKGETDNHFIGQMDRTGFIIGDLFLGDA